MNARPTHHPADRSAPCGIAGHALVSARLSEMADLRGRPGPPGAPALPPRFLRHCDEHTVVGMHAMLRALASRGAARADVSGDAVVAASCQPGRIGAARTLAGLDTTGAVGVSPHIVPQCSLHSVAGAVSVGLGMHGPHLGVGGGVDALAEGLFAAATLMLAAPAAGNPPCVWLVATEWDEEPALDATGAATGDPVCHGLALAIEPGAPAAADGSRGGTAAGRSAAGRGAAPSGPTLSLALRFPTGPRPRVACVPAAGRLVEFAHALDMCREGTALVSWAIECPWGAEIRVSRASVAADRARVVALRGRAA